MSSNFVLKKIDKFFLNLKKDVLMRPNNVVINTFNLNMTLKFWLQLCLKKKKKKKKKVVNLYSASSQTRL